MPAIDTTRAPEGALQTYEYVDLSYDRRGRNHRQSRGAVHVRRTRDVLVCRWRQSSVTGQLECVWGTERTAATPIEKNPTPVSDDFNRHHRRVEMRKLSQPRAGYRGAIIRVLLAVGWLASRLGGL